MASRLPSLLKRPLTLALPRRTFSTSSPYRLLATPLNLPLWLKTNSHLLQPPINNHCIYNREGVTVMIVGGPNARTDYHINSTPEWFYQVRGSMLLKVVDGSLPDGRAQFRDLNIAEGDMFLLPAHTPHNPVRFADTVGIVLELERPRGELDRLRWYCEGCGGVVHEVAFRCEDLGSQIKEAVEKFAGDLQARTCKACGVVAEIKPPGGKEAEA